jgi:uncharacterized protein (TIGR02231 family)
MKAVATIIAAFLIIPFLSGQQNRDLNTTIEKVTLFPDRAQVVHGGEVTLPQGTTILRIAGLSPKLIPATIQVEGKGGFMIMSVNQQTNYLANPEESSEVVALRKKIAELTSKIEDENTSIGVLREKETFLVSNRVITGSDKSINATDFKILTDQYVAGIESVRVGILKKSRIVKELEREKSRLENQISGVINTASLPSNEVLVSVSATKPVNAKLTLSYLVINAGWYPSYDIRVSGTDSPATIFYKANAWQNTGIDWKDVKLSFSSASPSQSGVLPTLNPWFINFYQVNQGIRIRGASTRPSSIETPQKRAMEIAESDFMELEEVVAFAPPVTIADAGNSFSFDLDIKQSVLSNANPSVIELQRLTAEAAYKYITIPKLKEEAYLTADISDWESLNLLDGEANIYFGNTFTGKTYINRSQLADTLNISLGQDGNISVKREKSKDLASTRVLGSNRVDTKSYKLVIRNNRTSKVKMVIYDQIPLTQNNQITVEAIELSGGTHNSLTGEVKWDIELDSNQTKEFTITYTVKYPKTQRVLLEN